MKHRTPLDLCPKCGATISAVTNATGRKPPKEGDFSICFYCCAPLLFGKTLKLRILTPAESATAPPELWQALDALNLGKQIMVQELGKTGRRGGNTH